MSVNFEDSGLGNISAVNLLQDQEQSPGPLTDMIFDAFITNLCLFFSSMLKSVELIKQGIDKTSRCITLSTLSTLRFTKSVQQHMTSFNNILPLKQATSSKESFSFFTSLLFYITVQCPVYRRGRTELIIQLHQNILSLGIKSAE